ncbi:sterol desaturase family protein [Massilia sp. W12]|uniref:sterol desaturase family protein n=1 Tax=Massilia sp. W12 TaxID=3126507 RepID=UPI0030D5052F
MNPPVWLIYPAILLFFILIFAREVLAPASRNHCDKRWLILAGSLNLLQAGSALLVGWLFREKLPHWAWFHLPEQIPAPLAGLLAFLITSFLFYWWHRALHQSDFLWRTVHQLHHSPQRLEALSAFYAHPLDSAGATLLSCFSAYIVLGSGVECAAWATLYSGLFNLYVHSDTRSPRWLGWIIQRPEMHRIHHRFGHHAQNYGLPLWDWMFGTLDNPIEEGAYPQLGFRSDQAERITEMLLGKDVSSG